MSSTILQCNRAPGYTETSSQALQIHLPKSKKTAKSVLPKTKYIPVKPKTTQKQAQKIEPVRKSKSPVHSRHLSRSTTPARLLQDTVLSNRKCTPNAVIKTQLEPRPRTPRLLSERSQTPRLTKVALTPRPMVTSRSTSTSRIVALLKPIGKPEVTPSEPTKREKKEIRTAKTPKPRQSIRQRILSDPRYKALFCRP